MFDVAEQLWVFTVCDGAVTGRSEHRLDALDHASTLSYLQVDVLICSAISQGLAAQVRARGVDVLSEICGPVNDVIDGYLHGALSEERFLTPARSRSDAGRPAAGAARPRNGLGRTPVRSNR